MKRNNKGFTLIEMLAAIAIMGILSTIGIVAVSNYLVQSRNKSFNMMSKSIYQAAQNCQIQGKCTGTIQIETLLEQGYLDTLKSPNASKGDCTGDVIITENGTSTSEYKDYQYKVCLTCPGVYKGVEQCNIWPN